MSNGTRLSHPADGRVYACRYCDGPRIRIREPEKAVNDPDCLYYCEDCKTGISKPVDREKRMSNGGGRKANHGLAKTLEKMSADNIGREAQS